MLLIKKAIIVNSESNLNGEERDLLINNGCIEKIGINLKSKEAKVIEAEGLHVSIGWLDIGAQIGEPGFEQREELATVSAAAAAGGYTALACFPNTAPAIHSKSEVNFLKNHSALVDFLPIGAVSRDCKGVDLAELYDMSAEGAVAFSDGSHPIASSGLMKRGLEYLKGIRGLLINTPFDESLAKGGQLHEGAVSTSLGLKGIPALSETLMLKRDLELLDYTNSRLHVHNISTAESVKLIKTAKTKGLKVTASVGIMNLLFNHEAVQNFDPNYKILPPLREKADMKTLQKGLSDGTIDIINSNHTPYEIESKSLEFFYAEFGIIGLETTYALLNTYLGEKFKPNELVHLLAIQPRTVLGLSIPKIAEKEVANLTLFQPNAKWTFTEKDIFSKSKNTPFMGTEFQGKVLGIVNGNYHNLA